MNRIKSVLDTMEEEEIDKFKEVFKYFKSKNSIPDFSKVVNLHRYNQNLAFEVHRLNSHALSTELEHVRVKLSVISPDKWKIFSLHNHPGLFIISNAFTDYGSMIWIKRCLQEFTDSPFKTNLSNLGLCKDLSWWPQVQKSLLRDQNAKLVNQLRWSTMGYHHNWDTKEYSESEKSSVPDDLEDLCRIFLSGIGYPHSKFKAEAAIVNFYPPGTTLSPHTDHSEPCREAPLLSFSFGRSGIFLIGGRDKSSAPTPLFLHHGDVMIMTKISRLCYHAVPRIMSNEDLSDTSLNGDLPEFIEYWNKEDLQEARNDAELSMRENNPIIKDSNKDHSNSSNNKEILNLKKDDIKAIINYIKTVRININIRQVNPSG